MCFFRIRVLALIVLSPIIVSTISAQTEANSTDGFNPQFIDTINNSNRIYQYIARNENHILVSNATHHFASAADNEIYVLVVWNLAAEGISGTQKSVLTSNFSTKLSKTTIEKENSEYIVRRSGNILRISGLYKNKSVDKTFNIDENDFYTNPTIGLIGFAESGNHHEEFWFLRPDKLRPVRIKAKNLGIHSITVNGRTQQAIKIQWGPVGLGSLFFREEFWFSVEHGVFLKNISRKGITTEMVHKTE